MYCVEVQYKSLPDYIPFPSMCQVLHLSPVDRNTEYMLGVNQLVCVDTRTNTALIDPKINAYECDNYENH